jgi:phage repressor protein C with HTH and peptisase S24 domain
LASVHRNTINRIERTAYTPGDVDEKTLKLIALALGLPVDDLIGYWQDRNVAEQKPPAGHGNQIPVLASIPASFNGDGDVQDAYDFEAAIDYMPGTFRDCEDPQMYGLVIQGDSMSPEYPDGSYITCSPKHWHDHGFIEGEHYAMRLVNGETTVKVVHLIDGGERLELAPLNPSHPTKRIQASDVQHAALVRGGYRKRRLPT